jgi:alpha-D-ribose 1-methylphosphonate 5-triphosphate diphosphatase
MEKLLTFTNGKIVTPTHIIENGFISIAANKIEAIGNMADYVDKPNTNEDVIDAHGQYILPGIIDIHTDALEAEIIPRPGADIPINVAFRELEKKMNCCGFTTVYHSLHLGYKTAEYGSRSKYSRQEVYDTIFKAINGDTLINNKIHLRFEITGVDAYDQCINFINNGYIQMLSVMDHTPGQGQYTKEVFMEVSLKNGKTEEQAIQDFEEKTSRPNIKGDKMNQLIQLALQKGIAVASHDDDTIDKIDEMKALGVSICEFPINMQTAAYAHEQQMHVIGGASNVLRGGSLTGNLNIKDAILNGYVTSLCSDYYPPAILHSIFKLNIEHNLTLMDTVKLGTLNPAKAVGIDQFTGSLEVGKDADLILVKLIDNIPTVTKCFVKGRKTLEIPDYISYNENSYLV